MILANKSIRVLGKIWITLCVPLAMVTMVPPAAASTASAGYVTNLVFQANGFVSFTQSGTRSTVPACATDTRWSVDASTALGQTRLSGLLTAYGLGKQISITGTGACGPQYPAMEEINYFTVLN
jgi:hypothetical protein